MHIISCDSVNILTTTQTRSPETGQSALGRAVVVGVIGEEGEVLAVEGELVGVVEKAVGSHQPTCKQRKLENGAEGNTQKKVGIAL